MRIRLLLIRTAARVSAEHVRWSSTAFHMDRAREPPARFTCDDLPMEAQSGSSHSEQRDFHRSRISWLTAAPSIRSSKLEATLWFEQDPPLKRIRCQYQSMMRISRRKRPPVSDAA